MKTQNKEDDIKDPTALKEQIKMLWYWITRLPSMIFDKQRDR